MGSRNKKRRCVLSLSFRGSGKKKRRKNKNKNNNNARAPSASKIRRIFYDVRYFEGELKDMRKLSSNLEAFHLPWLEIAKIIKIIHSRKTPTLDTYCHWDEYAVSFYLKMCTCFGVDYQHLEATSDQDVDQNETKEIMSLKEQEEHIESTQPSTKEMSPEERFEYVMNEELNCICLNCLTGPFIFGSYSSGTTPDRTPYHLYLLVKEAVDIMNNTNDLIELTRVEQKIFFFHNYFYSHLPDDWSYERSNASSLIAGYDTMGGPRYLLAGYTPFRDGVELEKVLRDEVTFLSPQSMADVMSIIHSRKTPTFWKMSWKEISFYCKLCSCFGIDYHRLEAASEDDVCLMITGRNG